MSKSSSTHVAIEIIFWIATQNVVFSMKSAYHLAMSIQSSKIMSLSVENPDKSMWNFLKRLMPFLGLNIVLGGSFITSFPLTSIHLIWECRLVPCVCFAGKNRSLRLMPYGTISWPRVFGLSSFLKCKLFFYCIGPLCIL